LSKDEKTEKDNFSNRAPITEYSLLILILKVKSHIKSVNSASEYYRPPLKVSDAPFASLVITM
jgi:hypothetical protein